MKSLTFLLEFEPKSFKEVESDENLISAMQDELNHYKRNKVVLRLKDHPVIRTKWVFRNKKNEVVRNKTRHVAQVLIKKKVLIMITHLRMLVYLKLYNGTCLCML